MIGAAVSAIAWEASAQPGATRVKYQRTVQGAAITRVVVVRSGPNTSDHTTSTRFVNIKNATARIGVPRGTKAILLVTFSGTGTCVVTGAANNNPCGVRVLVNSHQAYPMEPLWSSPGGLAPGSGGLGGAPTIQRAFGPYAAGTYTMHAQYNASAGVENFLDGWNMTIERIKQ